MSLKATFDHPLDVVERSCEAFYGDRLVSLAVFGSTARGTMRPDSDIDLLLVVDPLPDGRLSPKARRSPEGPRISENHQGSRILLAPQTRSSTGRGYRSMTKDELARSYL